MSLCPIYLLLQLQKMTEKVSAGREAKDGVNAKFSQTTPVDTPILASLRRRTVATNFPPEVKIPYEKQVHSISSSPIASSDSLKFLHGRDTCVNSGRSEDDLHVKAQPEQKESKPLKVEWVEQYEPGVYITITTLPNGQKALKRVRFR